MLMIGGPTCHSPPVTGSVGYMISTNHSQLNLMSNIRPEG